MKGRWYIDGIDIYTQYGVGLVEDGYNDIFQFPALITPDFNSWFELDGIDVDLSNPKLNNKTVDITFASVRKTNASIDSFLILLTKPGYREFRIESLRQSWLLRVSQESSRTVYKQGEQIFTIQFVDDFPKKAISQQQTKEKGHGFNLPKSMYSIDGKSLDKYGIVVEKGLEAMFSTPTLKKGLEVRNRVIDGIIYDVGHTRFSEKDVTLDCAFYCKNIDMFWNNYIAFFTDLTKSGHHQISPSYSIESYNCFYKSSDGFELTKVGESVVCKFDLTLTITKYKPSVIEVLATESRIAITTESGALILI